jgi:hypothetical protein
LRRNESEPRNNGPVQRIRSRSITPHILANRRSRAGRGAATAVVAVDGRGRRWLVMPASSHRRLVRVTPDLAQQGGVLPDCQCQHDRKDDCSIHVMLATSKGKSCSNPSNDRRWEILGFSRACSGPTLEPAEFGRSMPKIPHRNRSAQRGDERVIGPAALVSLLGCALKRGTTALRPAHRARRALRASNCW